MNVKKKKTASNEKILMVNLLILTEHAEVIVLPTAFFFKKKFLSSETFSWWQNCSLRFRHSENSQNSRKDCKWRKCKEKMQSWFWRYNKLLKAVNAFTPTSRRGARNEWNPRQTPLWSYDTPTWSASKWLIKALIFLAPTEALDGY